MSGKRFEKECQRPGSAPPGSDRVSFDVGVMPGVRELPLAVLRQPGMDLKRCGLLITEIGAEEDWRIDLVTIFGTQHRRAGV